jgi:hypothetical protein
MLSLVSGTGSGDRRRTLRWPPGSSRGSRTPRPASPTPPPPRRSGQTKPLARIHATPPFKPGKAPVPNSDMAPRWRQAVPSASAPPQTRGQPRRQSHEDGEHGLPAPAFRQPAVEDFAPNRPASHDGSESQCRGQRNVQRGKDGRGVGHDDIEQEKGARRGSRGNDGASRRGSPEARHVGRITRRHVFAVADPAWARCPASSGVCRLPRPARQLPFPPAVRPCRLHKRQPGRTHEEALGRRPARPTTTGAGSWAPVPR